MYPSAAILVLAWALAAYVVFLLVSSFISSRQNAAKARRLKCEEPTHQQNRYPFGVEHVVRALKADQAQEFPVDQLRRCKEVGAITYRYSVLGTQNVFTADEKNIQAILATQFADYELGPIRRGNFFPLLGNGIFTEDGKQWEHSRSLMRPQFAREQVSDLDLEERHVQNLMKALDGSMEGNSTAPVDLQVLLFRLTLDSATEFLFGESVDSQVTEMPGYVSSTTVDTTRNASAFAVAFDRGQKSLATRARFEELYWLAKNQALKRDSKIVHDYLDHFVRLALSRNKEKLFENGSSGPKEKYVFLNALAAQTQDPIELRSQLLNILLAGRDTTASLLGWLFKCLARDPIRYHKLRKIILDEFGTYENPREITFARLKNCRYLQHCNNETLRIYPVVPMNGRTANKDTTLPRGGGEDGRSTIFIPKGSSVIYSVYVMHHREDIWGPDVEAFNPERWEDRKVGWEYLPFNGGPRICLGQQFALTEASYVTVRLLQRFPRMEDVETDLAVKHNLSLTDCSGNGVKVKLHTA
ncbi:putative cytochrome P450 52A12 [Coleophoma cylindrospora]|uniref:Putative cytochrome P450 52A12 n=1 Tax=Coleophoma cylindrospora TaxID=1849047 RepID=A0A3D8R1V3_9HELO|nr:putative cytochrome P450 52A12 [Coleophoma cylindrospora]